jgi:isoquinoline 1-oxidoreductase subunit beta
MTTKLELSRRSFIQVGAAVGGGLLVGIAFPYASRWASAAEQGTTLNAWLRIDADNTLHMMIPQAEMGQGIETALPMLLCEELEADWRTVRTEFAPANPAYINPLFGAQATGGSTSVRAFSEPLRKVGAATRELLRQAAAEQWKVPPAQCTVANGKVTHAPTRRSATFGQLAPRAAKLTPPKDVTLKNPSQWKLAGKPTPRLDTAAKVTGKARFGIDVRVPGMLTGTVVACPVFGGKLKAVDDAPAKAVKGVKAVVKLPDALVVVADTYWHARKGAEALRPEWDEGATAAVDDAHVSGSLSKALDGPGALADREGDADGALAGAAKRVNALYEFPYLAHATMEPMNATAHVHADGATVWAPTQAAGPVQGLVAKVLNLKPEQVQVYPQFLGGGFGRKFEMDFILYPVFASKAVGAPVKVLWSREEDMRHDFYRPAAACRMEGGLDAGNRPVALKAKIVSPSIMSRVFPQFVKNGVDPTSVEGLAHSFYGFPNRHVETVITQLGVPVGFWRSVGNTLSGFIVESFQDELAAAAGADPVAFRLAQLDAKPRHKTVLERVAALGEWGKPLPAGHARGVAIHESFGSIVGEVAQISLDGNAVKVHRMACVMDCGWVVNPDTVVAQLESGIVYGLTAAFFGQINLNAGRAVQGNFPDYDMLRIRQMPLVVTEIVNSGAPHGGVGEPSTPPVAPAIANALFALTGKRARSLPLARHGYTLV